MNFNLQMRNLLHPRVLLESPRERPKRIRRREATEQAPKVIPPYKRLEIDSQPKMIILLLDDEHQDFKSLSDNDLRRGDSCPRIAPRPAGKPNR